MRNLILIMASLSMLLFGCDDTEKKKTEAKPDVAHQQMPQAHQMQQHQLML
jgi:outer membrane biogenesis lipoprotein LolB